MSPYTSVVELVLLSSPAAIAHNVVGSPGVTVRQRSTSTSSTVVTLGRVGNLTVPLPQVYEEASSQRYTSIHRRR